MIQILGRVTSNWISKYNLCVVENFEYLKTEALTEEVKIWKHWLENKDINVCSICPPKEVLFESVKESGGISSEAVQIIESMNSESTKTTSDDD